MGGVQGEASFWCPRAGRIYMIDHNITISITFVSKQDLLNILYGQITLRFFHAGLYVCLCCLILSWVIHD